MNQPLTVTEKWQSIKAAAPALVLVSFALFALAAVEGVISVQGIVWGCVGGFFLIAAFWAALTGKTRLMILLSFFGIMSGGAIAATSETAVLWIVFANGGAGLLFTIGTIGLLLRIFNKVFEGPK